MKKWWEVYPKGTKEGDEENDFFCALARSEHVFRTVEGLAIETKLSETRIEEIIQKYEPSGMIVNDSKDPELWGYWERVGLKPKEQDILVADQDLRMKKIKP